MSFICLNFLFIFTSTSEVDSEFCEDPSIVSCIILKNIYPHHLSLIEYNCLENILAFYCMKLHFQSKYEYVAIVEINRLYIFFVFVFHGYQPISSFNADIFFFLNKTLYWNSQKKIILNNRLLLVMVIFLKKYIWRNIALRCTLRFIYFSVAMIVLFAIKLYRWSFYYIKYIMSIFAWGFSISLQSDVAYNHAQDNRIHVVIYLKKYWQIILIGIFMCQSVKNIHFIQDDFWMTEKLQILLRYLVMENLDEEFRNGKLFMKEKSRSDLKIAKSIFFV